MAVSSDLDHLRLHLDDLERALAAGSPESIERQAAVLEASLDAVRRLLETPQARAAVAAKLAGIRAQVACLREMLEHGELVRQGIAGILGMFYEAHSGSQYSACGAPTLTMLPRVITEA
jgi:hypothetical protein